MVSTTDKGKRLERLVAMMEHVTHPHSVVELNMPIWDEAAQENRDFDVTRHETTGGPVLAAIECKDHRRPIGVGVIDCIHTKAQDCGIENVAIASTSGFSRGAVRKCIAHGIFPLIMHADDSVEFPDWFVPDRLLYARTSIDVVALEVLFADGTRLTKKGVPKDKPFIRLSDGKEVTILHAGLALHCKLPPDQSAADTAKGSIEFEDSAAPVVISDKKQRLVKRLNLVLTHSRTSGDVRLVPHSLRTLQGNETGFAIVSEPIGQRSDGPRLALMFRVATDRREVFARVI